MTLTYIFLRLLLDLLLANESMWTTIGFDILVHIANANLLELRLWHCVVNLFMLYFSIYATEVLSYCKNALPCFESIK